MSAQGGATGSVHVNVFGGPGSGKSTMAYAVAAELKARGYTAECVGEVVKDCIYDAARGDQEAARLLDGSVESQEELYRRQSARERRLDGLVQFVRRTRRPSWASPTSPPTPTRTGRRGWRPSRRTSSRHRSRST
ncbi:MAG: hypothetical protein ACLSVD_00980 [Eggerthellaceae bacterium]